MPASLFNFSRYLKKNPTGANPTLSDNSASVQSQNPTATSEVATVTTAQTTRTTSTPVPYSGIGNPPGGHAYSGIGNPPISNPKTPINANPPAEQSKKATTSPPSASSSAIDMKKRVGMDVLSRLTQRANSSLMLAVSKAKELKLQYIDTEHVLWGLLQDSSIYQLISECKAMPSEIKTDLEKDFKPGSFNGTPQFSPRIKRVLELSLAAAKTAGYEFISPEHILLALFQEGEGVAARTLVKFHLTSEMLTKKVTGKKDLEKKEEERKQSTLEQFTVDLTAKAAQGELDPVVARSNEIERVIHILSRRTKNNPVLIGDAGVGKTAIVEGLALKIAHAEVPETLLHKRILLLDLMSLIAGAKHRGEFEERLKNLIKEVKAASGAIILFIDELHNMVGAGGSGEGTMDASNILKPSLARGELQLIGTTTVTEYRKYVEKDPALERRFQPVFVAEPTAEAAIEMVKALRDKYEAFHRVKIPDETVEAAVHLSQKYISDRALPDKAVDLIDEGGAAVRLPAISLPEEIRGSEEKLKKLTSEKAEAEKIGDKVRADNTEKEIEELQPNLTELKEQYQKSKSTTTNVVTADDVAAIVSHWTNIPVSRLTESESSKLLKLEDIIHQRLIDQEDAVSAVSEAVRRGRAGLKSNKRPIGSFIFMGPTGVGKTELAKTLADTLFGSDEMMVRLDMTEYMEKHEVAKLIGAPPGYVGYEEGGQLTEAVRRRPYSVVLLDEIEKAHPDVFNILIQLLDDGRLTDNKGRTISFKNTIVICTSNLGSGLIQQEMLGWKEEDKKEETKDKKPEENKKVFTTYAISPTGRQIITFEDHVWEKDTKETSYKHHLLSDYFAGSTIIHDPEKLENEEFPKNFETHLISPDGSETITNDDTVWFRTSTTAKEWTSSKMLQYFKDHVVINALPDKPEEQLPTAKIDTHTISPTNEEVITLANRYWRRENLQTKDWTTGLFAEYFVDNTLSPTPSVEIKPGEQNPKEAAVKVTESKSVEDEFDTKNPDVKKDVIEDKTEEAKSTEDKTKTTEEPHFPLEKWDIHLFTPVGAEIIISKGEFWQRNVPGEKVWSKGTLAEMFKDALVEGGKKEEAIPIGQETEVKEEKAEKSDENFINLTKKLMDELQKFFRPELINRFDEVVVFRPLLREHMMAIVNLQAKGLSALLREQNIAIEITDPARAYLAEMGFDPIFGARPLRRTIQRTVENPISELLIKGEVVEGDTIITDFDGNGLVFEIKKMVKREIPKEEISSASPQVSPAEASKKEEEKITADPNAKTTEASLKYYKCANCSHDWNFPIKDPVPTVCPSCASELIKEVQAPLPESKEKWGADLVPEQTAGRPQAAQTQSPTPSESSAVTPDNPIPPQVNTPPPGNPLESYLTETPSEVAPVSPPPAVGGVSPALSNPTTG